MANKAKKICRELILKIQIKRDKKRQVEIMKLKEELKQEKKEKEEFKKMNHKLIDMITLQNIKIRELKLNK